MSEFVRALKGCRTVLDVGCGACSPLRVCSAERLVGYEAYEPDLEKARIAATHDEFVQGTVQELGERFHEGQFEACCALDVIEHLTKTDGLEFLATVERIASKKVLIFTPCGFMPQASVVPGDFQEHLSGWLPDEMRALGCRVIGLDGIGILRGEYHRLRFEPKVLWALVSWVSQHLWARSHPSHAAAILCVKDVGNR